MRKECHRWSWSCFTMTWHRGKVIMKLFLHDKMITKLFSMTRWWSWSFTDGSQHYCKGMIINTFLLNWERFLWTQEEMCVCVFADHLLTFFSSSLQLGLHRWNIFRDAGADDWTADDDDDDGGGGGCATQKIKSRNWKLWDCNHNTSST